MGNKGKHIDDISKRELNNYTSVPKSPVWEKLEKRLLEHAEQKKRKSNKKWYLLSLLFVVFVASVFTGKEIINGRKNNKLVNNVKNNIPIVGHNTNVQLPQTPKIETRKEKNEVHVKNDTKTKEIIKTSTNVLVSKQSTEKKLLNTTVNNKAIYKKERNKKLTKRIVVKQMQNNTVSSINKEILSSSKQEENTAKEETQKQLNAIIPQSPNTNLAAVMNNTENKIMNDSVSPATQGDGTSTPSTAKKIHVGFDGGMQIGIERGFQQFTTNKLIVAPYIQLNTGGKLSLLLQPGIKFGNVTAGFKQDEQGVYNVTNNRTDSTVIMDTSSGRILSRSYYYKQNYDSIIISHKATGSYWEMELPILLKYQLNQHLSVFGGPVISFMHIVQVQQEKTVSHFIREDSATNTVLPLPEPDYSSLFLHTGMPYSSYHEPTAYQNGPTTAWGIGYMAGVNYLLNSNLFIDILIQQTPGAAKNVPNADIKLLYTQPYIRISIGYKLFSKK